jgi:hypothetical protein
LQRDLSQGGLERLGPPTGVARFSSTAAGRHRPGLVAPVGIQAALHGPSRQSQRTPPHRGFDRFEVQLVCRTRADQRLDFAGDLAVEEFREPLFLAASASEAAAGVASSVWQSRSLVSTSSCTNARNLRYSSSCRRVCSTPSAAITWVTVLPSTVRVSEKQGP